jgi:predicted nucleic acid-binding protein
VGAVKGTGAAKSAEALKSDKTANAVGAVLTRMQGKRVYFDTAPIIFAIENVPGYAELCIPFFQASEARQILGFTGAITLTEMLVKPMRIKNADITARIKSLFAVDDVFTCVDHARDAYVLAAELRAEHNYKMVDALQCATAIVTGCNFFITNDFKFKSTAGLEVICVEDLRGSN